MHIRCSYCSQTFNLSRDYMVPAIEKAERKGHKYHAVECINCRKQVKVPLAQMIQQLPAAPDEAETVEEEQAAE